MPKKKTPAKPVTVQLTVRVVPDEMERFHAAAEEVGLKITDWVRQTLRRSAGMKAFGVE